MSLPTARIALGAALWIVSAGCPSATSSDSTGAGTASASASTDPLPPPPAPPEPSYGEVPWADVMGMIRAGKVRWIVQTRGRRVYLRTIGDERYASTEPRQDDVIRLLRAVDPTHTDLGITTHDEVPWSEAVELIRGDKVVWAEQRDSRRVYLYTRDDGWVLSFEPRTGEIWRVVKELGKVRELKLATHEEIPWREALALLRADAVTHVSAMHGRRVYLQTRDRGEPITIAPEGVTSINELLQKHGSTAGLTVE